MPLETGLDMNVHTNGIDIHYEMTGKPGAPAVVLSHSLGSGLTMWDPQTAALQPRYRLLRYDTRGHGRSTATEGPYRLGQLAADAIGMMDALKLERVHWVGLSMGGMIGQCVALDYPGRLLSLCLCDTAAVIGEESQPVWDERIAAIRNHGPKALVDATLSRWFTPAFLNRKSRYLAAIRDQFLATPVAGFVGCSEAIRRLNTLERLSEIRVPTLIMVGENDPGTPVEASRMMHARIPRSRLVIIPSAAHLSNVEQAEIFNTQLLGFLDEQEP